MEKQFKQGYLCDLELKSLPDLVDIQRRQKAILANKRLLQTLSDKGEKIRHFVARIDAIISDKEKQLQQRSKKSIANESATIEDTEDNICTSSPASDAMDSYVSALAEKFDAQLCIETPVFKPCRTLTKRGSVKAEPATMMVENEDDRDAVHLPHLRNKPPEVLPLAEIFKLQKEQDKKLKDLKTRPSPETATPLMNEVDESHLLESKVFELDADDDHIEDDIDSVLF